ncbi:MAG: lysine 5,6-aminomutase subunit alpha [Bacilli bacterium]|nr:lysine 5,6-aminomutase subunit alpha [Bacilli bacterium]
MNKLRLNPNIIAEARTFAKQIALEVQAFIDVHSTVAVERSVCRMLGIDGVDEEGIPLANIIVDAGKESIGLEKGISNIIASSLKYYQCDLNTWLLGISSKQMEVKNLSLSKQEIKDVLEPYLRPTLTQIKENKKIREQNLEKYPEKKTQIYVIVATGNIFEDIKQAKAAAIAGADIVAVIRSTGQSLLDYVPNGATTEGFGGTYATQENFRLMRKALDEVTLEEKRYIKLVNYASGLCMPEIATLAARERLDILLNDSMYGIIFRDINMQRTFVDQYFSRLINAYAGIIINTGEDNYLTTSDAYEEAHTVLASQFINEQFAYLAHLPAKLMGLGHAFEIDPMLENSFLYEVAQAQMAREIFPDAPLKYMPPTKHITGNIFRAYMQNTLFNIATTLTSQSIHLLGMLTEAIHTPWLADRQLAIENAKTIQVALKDMASEIYFKEDGIIETRAQDVLLKAKNLLSQIANDSLFVSLSNGVFANVKRSKTGGKGLDGVFVKDADYVNVVMDAIKGELS